MTEVRGRAGSQGKLFSGRVALLLGSVVVVVVAAVLRSDLHLVPFDEGTLAHTGQRVLNGDIPHVDFIDPYTGAMAALLAALFRIFGESLLVMRYLFVGVSVLTSAALFHALRRRNELAAAALSLIVLITWTTVNRTPMPSFVTTCLVLVGAAVAMTGQRTVRTPLVAGFLVGVAGTVKITALYALGAFWLYYLAGERSRWRTRLMLLPVLVALVVLTFRPSIATYLYFGLPLVGVTYLAVRYEPVKPRDPRELVPFVLGASTVPGIAMLFYLFRGDFVALFDGAVEQPLVSRTVEISQDPPDVFIALLVFGLIFGPIAYAQRRRWSPAPAIAGLGVAGCVALVVDPGATYLGVLVIVSYGCLGAVVLALTADARIRVDAILWLGLAGFSSLVAFPYFQLYYVLYSIPFLLAALYTSVRPRVGAQLVGFLGAFLVASVLILDVAERVRHGYPTLETISTLELQIRGDILRVEEEYAYYAPLIRGIELHRGEGGVWAAPDLADLYFATDSVNPTINTYEFLSRDPYPSNLSERLVDSGVCVVALNRGQARVSPMPTASQLAALAEAFPHEEMIGPIELRWRLGDSCGGDGG